MSDDSFLIHTRADEFLERVGVNNKVAQVLQQHMKESATYPNILDPPGCLFCKLRLREDNLTTISVGTTHITWKELKYPILQMLQVRADQHGNQKGPWLVPCRLLTESKNRGEKVPLFLGKPMQFFKRRISVIQSIF